MLPILVFIEFLPLSDFPHCIISILSFNQIAPEKFSTVLYVPCLIAFPLETISGNKPVDCWDYSPLSYKFNFSFETVFVCQTWQDLEWNTGSSYFLPVLATSLENALQWYNNITMIPLHKVCSILGFFKFTILS